MKKATLLLLLLGPFILPLSAQTPMTFDWVAPIYGGSVNISHIELDVAGDIVNFGTIQIDADMDPGPDTVMMISPYDGYTSYIQKLDSEGNLRWYLPFYGTQSQGARAMTLLPDGDILAGIIFYDTLFYENQFFLGNTTQPDVAILKVSSEGDLIWAKHFKGDHQQVISSLQYDQQGNIYATGSHIGATDFDPDPVNTFLLTTPLNNAVGFVLKLNPAGELIQVKEFSSSNFTSGSELIVSDNDLYVGGYFSGTADLDPGPGQQTLNSTGSGWDGFLVKLDTDFNYKWALPTGGAGLSSYYSASLDQAGNVLMGGVFSGELDLDPGPGQTLVTSAGSEDIFFQKFSPTGELLWTKYFGGAQQEFLYDAKVDIQNNLYAFGVFRGNPDFDPGPGVHQVASQGSGDGFVLKLGPDGQFIDVRTIGGRFPDDINAGFVDDHLNVYIAGGFAINCDMDPGAPIYTLPGSFAGFVEVLTQQYHYEGQVFRDLNSNGQKDPGEPPMPGAVVSTKRRQAFASSDQDGNYFLNYHLNHDTIALNTRPYWTVNPLFYAITNNQTNLDFAVSGPIVKDICVTAAELGLFRPGFPNEIVIQVSNPGGVLTSFIPLSLKITTQTTPDPIQLTGAIPAPSQVFANEFRWTIPMLQDGEVATFRVLLQTPTTVPIGSPVKISISTPAINDLDPFNNGLRIESVTVGSYDPNDKQVTPAKVTPEGLDSTQLRYVVRFQNTGTFPAELVVVKDTLPLELDIRTLKVLGASHQFTWRMSGSGILEFRFDPILLPDSTSNEPASKGFIVFTVKPKPGLALGDSVRNRVGIYFDFNEPVITNYATMKVALPVDTVNPLPENNLHLTIHPNPARAKSDMTIAIAESLEEDAAIMIFDAQGRIVQVPKLNRGDRRFTLEALPAGAYFVQLRAGGRTGGQVLIVK